MYFFNTDWLIFYLCMGEAAKIVIYLSPLTHELAITGKFQA